MCDTVFVSSGAVHCFVLAVKLMLQSGVQQGGEIAGVAIHTFTYLYPRCEHNAIFCRYPGTGSWAPRVDSPIGSCYILVAKGLPARNVPPKAIPGGIVNAEVLYGEAPREVEPLTLLYSTLGKKGTPLCISSINKRYPIPCSWFKRTLFWIWIYALGMSSSVRITQGAS